MKAGLVLSCEHASLAVPPDVELGVPEVVLSSHRGWDEGALALGEALALAQGAPLRSAEVSRLVVDLNRSPQTAIPRESFGLEIPGNLELSLAEATRRLERYHRPHREALLAAALAEAPCIHLSIHSFVRVLSGVARELEVGILFDPARGHEAAASEALIAGLALRGWDARANEPYLGTDDGLTTWLRPRLPDGRYAGIEVELAQALVPERRAALARDLNQVLSEVRAAWPPEGGVVGRREGSRKQR